MHTDNWYILGAGSIGCLWASSLCYKGESPRIILKESSYHQFEQKRIPLNLLIPDRTCQFYVNIVSPEMIDSPINRLIVCTKAQDALAALNSIRLHLTDNCKILLLQNGMGSQQLISNAFPTQTVWAGVSTDGAYLVAPFEVCHAGQGQTCIGPLRQNHQSERGFNDLFDNFRLKIIRCDAIEQKLWEKLAINSCINGLTALFNCRNGELLDNGEKQDWLDQLIAETRSILEALEIPATSLKEKVHKVCQTTANNISSTCQDVRKGKTTELSFINGFLIKQANALGVSVSRHNQLMGQLNASEIRVRSSEQPAPVHPLGI